MQLLPAPALGCYVKHYLCVDSIQHTRHELRFFSDGNPGIVFCQEGQLYTDATLLTPYPPIFGYGQIAAYKTLYTAGVTRLMIAVLHPFAMSALLKTTAWELTDMIFTTEQLFTAKHRRTMPSDVHQLNSFLSGVFQPSLTDNELVLSAVIGYIQQTHGVVTAAQLEDFSGYTERYLQKKFKEHVGISPKKFARITRLLTYLKTLQSRTTTSSSPSLSYPSLSSPSYSLSQQAHMAGYFDQAHLNHDFKSITGITPSEYKQSLALNLITLS
jgi:AraC-like DNA-binding protein